MGLDMYLTADLYLWNYKDEDKELARQIEKVIGDLPPLEDSDSYRESRIKTIGIEVLYWRKANAIHQWFVDNVQDGDDDCKSYFVEEEQLKELAELCQEVIDVYEDSSLSDEDKSDKMEELLPCTAGFFFGSQEYDEWYINDIKRTIVGINKFLETDLAKRCDFYYRASW